jgi:DNA-binding transcriptional MerR regulator
MRELTVKQLAKLSGVSVRALHHYDEIGLLKPAYVGGNGYRYYGQEEHLRLQQILFHRELGLSLDGITQVLDAPGFDRVAALKAHRAKLTAEAARYGQLVRTIDETLAALEGDQPMDEKAVYRGFDPEAAAKQQAWVIERFGEGARQSIQRREKRLEGWTQADFDRSQADFASIIVAYWKAFVDGVPADGDKVQAITEGLRRHVDSQGDGPVTRAGLLHIATIWSEEPIMRARHERMCEGLADYIDKAMRHFAETRLR